METVIGHNVYGDGRIVVYAGKGASHSWTWLADLFDSVPQAEAVFVDESEMTGALNDGCSRVVVSGGDAFQIARCLSRSRFGTVETFVRNGGHYVGICAGAYLPLPSSVSPLSEFNLSTTKIENILADFHTESGYSERLSLSYCDRTIVHPVRGEVLLDVFGELVAPLYGGPIFHEPSVDEVVFRYTGFTERSQFNIGLKEATGMVVGKPAAIRSRVGEGSLLLIGPHLEHPGYSRANVIFLELLDINAEPGRSPRAEEPTGGVVDAKLRGALADLRVAISGLENRSFLVGRKLWDAERLLVLHRAVDSRAQFIGSSETAAIVSELRLARDALVRSDDDSGAVDRALDALMSAARRAVNSRFQHPPASDDFIRAHHDSFRNEG
ncbi:MAG: hypothetical protein JSV90_06705 [Methanobacteriota archaeon]|nr:MAG: hypothetical protein JSV90_06705 [Euryarchaeota archaeon]